MGALGVAGGRVGAGGGGGSPRWRAHAVAREARRWWTLSRMRAAEPCRAWPRAVPPGGPAVARAARAPDRRCDGWDARTRPARAGPSWSGPSWSGPSWSGSPRLRLPGCGGRAAWRQREGGSGSPPVRRRCGGRAARAARAGAGDVGDVGERLHGAAGDRMARPCRDAGHAGRSAGGGALAPAAHPAAQAVERGPARSHGRPRHPPAIEGGRRPGRRPRAFGRTPLEIAAGAESRAREPRRCRSACNEDPVGGVIGVRSGPP